MSPDCHQREHNISLHSDDAMCYHAERKLELLIKLDVVKNLLAVRLGAGHRE